MVYLVVQLEGCLFVCLFVCWFVCLFVCLFVCYCGREGGGGGGVKWRIQNQNGLVQSLQN